jgi:hypothetical protein
VLLARFVDLTTVESIKAFAYKGEKEISEDKLKCALRAGLEAEGWATTIQMGKLHGIDIEASRNEATLIIEVKGEGSRSAMRVNYFLAALGELLQRMKSPDPTYALAFPAHRQFVGLVLRLPIWVQRRLNLVFFFVRPIEDEGFEIGRVALPDALTTQ